MLCSAASDLCLHCFSVTLMEVIPTKMDLGSMGRPVTEFDEDILNLFHTFYTPPHDSGRVLWFHVGRLCICTFTHLSSVCMSFLNDNLSKHQWIFTKLDMCIDITEIWFGIINGQILSIFDRGICPPHIHIFISG